MTINHPAIFTAQPTLSRLSSTPRPGRSAVFIRNISSVMRTAVSRRSAKAIMESGCPASEAGSFIPYLRKLADSY